VASQSYPSLEKGYFGILWPGLLRKGVAYAVDYYGDLSGNGACDAPPTDHVWHQIIDTVKGDVTLSVSHDADWSDECASFATLPTRHDLTFSAQGFADYNQQKLWLFVSRTGEQNALIHLVIPMLDADPSNGGDFSFTWPGLLESGTSYRLDYSIDLDGNGSCDMSPKDANWHQDVPKVSDSDVVVTSNPGNNIVSACPSFP
jgi:hypothetical protein